MNKYHINSNGEPGVCRAKKACPFGGGDVHFPTAEKARNFFESKMTQNWRKDIPPDLAEAIEYECVRQHVDYSRRGYLLEGWERGRETLGAGQPLTLELLLEIAFLVEPDNGGKLRQTPVTFAQGGFAVAADVVPAGVAQLIRFWPSPDDSDEDKLYWIRESLVVHFLKDGNGRLNFVLFNALMNSWDKPMRLPYFEF